MAFRIRTNVPSLFGSRNLNLTMRRLNNTIERLSTGFRINKAADDPAGLAISERLSTQVNGLSQAERNVQDAVSLVQIAEGGLAQISTMLQRMRTLSVQAANDTNTSGDRTLIQVEINQLIAEIDRQVSTAEFNNNVLLRGAGGAGTGAASFTFQVGADKGETLALSISAVSAQGLGVDNLSVEGATNAAASSAIATLDTAIDRLTTSRGNIGAIQNRLENAVNFIGISKENMTAARSRVRDADMAQEIVHYTRDTILLQTGTAFLAQANVIPTQALSLIQ
jgi:flagellin